MRVATTSDIQRLQALRQCTALTHLDISGSYLQDCLAGELAAALQAMPRLTRLHACNCALQSQRSVVAIASALQPLTQLQHLHLARSRLGEAGLAALAPALSAMPGLQTLHVGDNRVSVKGTRHLCTLLGAVPGLTHLDVSCSPLRGEGAPLLAAVVRGMTSLQTLNMSYYCTGDIGMVAFAPALAALPHLHTLNLSANELGTGAVSMLLGGRPPTPAEPQFKPATTNQWSYMSCSAQHSDAAAGARPFSHGHGGRGLGCAGPSSQPPWAFCAIAGDGP